MFTKRMLICLVTGAMLGVVCIVGAQIRSGFTREAVFFFAFWFNRLLMGLVIGLVVEKLPIKWLVVRGALLGGIVSFAFYSGTGFEDAVGFIAGIFYGVIIEFVALKLEKTAIKKDKVR